MPLNWNGDHIPSKADKMTNILGFKEIGGVGQLIYHPFRFVDYEWFYDKNDICCAKPICRPGYEPIFPNEDALTGKGLLVSLCNLAMEMNDFKNTVPREEQIITWCKKNMHPYSIDFIYTALNTDFNINSFDAEIVEKDGIFSIDEFMDDLGKLYNAVMFYVALEGICVADDLAAYDLSKEGKYFEGYPFFEKYKKAYPEVPDDILSGENSRENLLAEMKRENDYIASHPVEQPPEGEFATTPFDDYEELLNRLIELIPDFRMRMKIDPRTNRPEFSTDVQSVFDIAWYTLARMLSEDPAPENKGKPDSRPEGIMIRCRHCGRFIIRKGKRQEYCDSEECQKARNARKQKAFRERKAIEKAQKAKKKPCKTKQSGKSAENGTAPADS